MATTKRLRLRNAFGTYAMRETGQRLVVELLGWVFWLVLQILPNSYGVATPKGYIQK